MHRCSSSQGNMVGPCSCDLFHYHHHQYHHSHSYSSSPSSPPSSFSMLFSKPYDHDHLDHHDHHDLDHQMYSFGSGVDCTLSLGTPSTRLCSNDDVYEEKRSSRSDQRRSDSCVSNFCWDLFQPKQYSPSNAQTTSSHHKNGVVRGGNNNSNSSDPLVARRCANCDTTSTPLWRNGPRGPKSLCNACGIRFKKEERRAAAAAPPAATLDQPPSHVFSHHQYHHSNNSINPWNNNFSSSHNSQPQKFFSAANEFRFMDASAAAAAGDMSHADAAAADAGISFLSWRLNVTDRPSFVHDFTR